MYGRPGATYIDMPADLITGEVDEAKLYPSVVVKDPPISLACPSNVAKTLELLRTAKKPLIIVGKGCAYARAEKVRLQNHIYIYISYDFENQSS